MSRTDRRRNWRWPTWMPPNPGEVKSWVRIYRGRERAQVRDELRRLWGIAFTGHNPERSEWGHELPCPADFNRPPASPSDHRQWGGNTPQGYTWPAELVADNGGRGRPARRRRWGRRQP